MLQFRNSYWIYDTIQQGFVILLKLIDEETFVIKHINNNTCTAASNNTPILIVHIY